MYVVTMELKVWVEGIQRVICGVTESTTCQDVVIALAHATGKTGRFTLVERWRDNERLLAPTEPPLRVLHKWGEYACDVQFILRHSDKDRRKAGSGSSGGSNSSGQGGNSILDHGSKRTEKFLHNFSPHGGPGGSFNQQRRSSGSSIRKSLTFSGAHTFFPPVKSPQSSAAPESTGQSKPQPQPNCNASKTSSRSTSHGGGRNLENCSFESFDDQLSSGASFSSCSSPYASLDKQRRNYAPPGQPQLGGNLERPSQGLQPHSPHRSPHLRPGAGGSGVRDRNMSSPNKTSPVVRHHPQQTIPVPNSVPPVPAPHRDNNNKVNYIHSTNNNNIAKVVPTSYVNDIDYKIDPKFLKPSHDVQGRSPTRDIKESRGTDTSKHNGALPEAEPAEKTPKKDDLLRLVRLQQERLGVQDSQLKILDSEIQYWEGREQDFDQQYRTVQEETSRLQQTEKSLDDSLQELDLVSWVDKLEIEKQHEKMLKSELTLVRSQLANAESELLATRSRITSLNGELEEERRENLSKEQENKEQEIKMLQEISDLQKQVNKKLLEHEQNSGSLDQLVTEVKSLESEILEKKTQIADCEKELRAVNMNSFVQSPSTDWLQPPDQGKEKSHGRLSPSRPGSSRKMMLNPHMLKETVATTKNPHGMWV